MTGKMKYKVDKVKKFKVTEEDKVLLKSDDQSLRQTVVKEIEDHIAKYVQRIEEINSSKDKEESNGTNLKTTKKNLILKLRKLRKELTDEAALKKRVNVMKTKRRKLKSLCTKIEERLDKIKMKKVRCFRCRRRGHAVVDCKLTDEEAKAELEKNGLEEDEESDDEEEENILESAKEIKTQQNKVLCYNCGSLDHNIYGCSKPVDYKDLPFAECFICKKQGHISSKCPLNDKGIYIKGGSCFVCEKNDHLAKNCPTKQLLIMQEKEKEREEKLKKAAEAAEAAAAAPKKAKGRTFLNSKRRYTTPKTNKTK